MKTIVPALLMGILLAAGVAAAVETDKKEAYPIDTCIVSGKKLGVMGDPITYDAKGRTIMFCCKGCVAKYEAKAEEYGKKLDEAIIAKQKPTYPMKTCVVSGDKLDEPADYVYKNRLIEFCCKDCINAFNKEPAKYLKLLDDAGKSGAAKTEAEKPAEKHEAKDHDHK